MLNPGDKAPLDIQVADQDGKEVKLSSYQGQKLVVYFYPKDNTPGCTKEACSLRDGYQELRDRGYEIVGVSPDSEKSHTNFRTKHDLPFRLLADRDHQLIKAFGAWGEKSMYGKKYEGLLRSTFLLDEDGKVTHVIKKVKTADHANQILGVLEES